MKDNKCTNPRLGRLIGAYELELLEEAQRREFVNHLIECLHCHNEVFAMAPVMEALRRRREAACVRRQRQTMAAQAGVRVPVWRRKTFVKAASVVVAIGTALAALLLRERNLPPTSAPDIAPESSWGETLVVPKAEYVPPRPEPTPLRSGDAATLFDRAIENYQNGNYAVAAHLLEGVVHLQPDNASAYFYWGVALLLVPHAAEAIAPLERAVELEAGTFRDRARYYLALAYLKTGQPDRARAQLEAILQNVCPYRSEAEKLLHQLRRP